MAYALKEAVKAEQFALAAQLATELEARRRDRADVVDLDAERTKRRR